MSTPTPHNAAVKGQIAKTVLLPGDPDRARYIAENFLTDAQLVSEIRGIPCYTGKYNGKSVSVMASGMGGASAGIYSWELFTLYDVDNIIRIGTAGGFKTEIAVGDLVMAMSACTDSNYAYQYNLHGTYSPCADFNLLQNAMKIADSNSIKSHAGMIFSSDMYSDYNAMGDDLWHKWADYGCLCQDMETYALYCNAKRSGKKALSILTNVADCITGKCLEGGIPALQPMIKVALELAAV